MKKIMTAIAIGALVAGAGTPAMAQGGEGRMMERRGDDARPMQCSRPCEPRMGWGERRGQRGQWGRGMMRQGRMMRPQITRMMFILADSDGSRTLSVEEVLAVHERIFVWADADGDGELTMAEARAFMRGVEPARQRAGEAEGADDRDDDMDEMENWDDAVEEAEQ